MASGIQISESPRLAIVGSSGYAGAELARLLLLHPRVNPESLLFLGRSSEGSAVALDEIHPQLTGLVSKSSLVEPFTWEKVSSFGAEFLLLATPHEQSREWVPTGIAKGLRVLDLSGAWRLKDEANRGVYNLVDSDPELADSLQKEAVFGAPELHREAIATARLVANPGCYSTSIILALAPLLRADLVDLDRGIISDSKSGVSGAGKAATAKTHFMSRRTISPRMPSSGIAIPANCSSNFPSLLIRSSSRPTSYPFLEAFYRASIYALESLQVALQSKPFSIPSMQTVRWFGYGQPEPCPRYSMWSGPASAISGSSWARTGGV